MDVVRSLRECAPSGLKINVLEAGGRRWDVRGNFERAIAVTTGTVVVLADQDDRWSPSRIEQAYRDLTAVPGRLLVAHNSKLIDATGAPTGLTLFESMGVAASELRKLNSVYVADALVRRNVLAGMGFMFHRSLASNALPIPAAWTHDYWLAFLAAAQGGLMVSDDSSLLEYRQHAGNVLGAGSQRLLSRAARLFNNSDDPTRRLVMFETLADRVANIKGVSARTQNAILGKANFERKRAAIPQRRSRRVAPVAKLAMEGGYRDYASNGGWNALRDLVADLSSESK